SREAFRKPANRRGPHRSGEELDRGDEKTAERQREEEEMVQKERTPSSLRIHRDPRSESGESHNGENKVDRRRRRRNFQRSWISDFGRVAHFFFPTRLRIEDGSSRSD